MDLSNYELETSLNQDLDDYFQEMKKYEIIWMMVFIAAVLLMYLLVFVLSLNRKIKEIEIMNIILGKLVSIPKGK